MKSVCGLDVHKVTEIFCIADDFCKVFDAQMEKYTIKSILKRKYQRESTMSKAEIMVVIILFHSSGFRCLKHFYKELEAFLQRICMCTSSTFISKCSVI